MDQTTTSERSKERTSVPGTYALEGRNITKTFSLGKESIAILKGISLTLRHGEMLTLVGPSGSGKSTLLGIIAGLDHATSGQVLLDGVDITQMKEGPLARVRNTKIGMVYQAFNLIPTLTAQENVEVPLYVGRHHGSPAKRAQEMLALVGLGHRLHNAPRQLSGGEQQRVAIARALVTRPTLLIMDEPTGNLDVANGEKVLALIQDLQRQLGTSCLIATHDHRIAQASDYSIHLLDGQRVDEEGGSR